MHLHTHTHAGYSIPVRLFTYYNINVCQSGTCTLREAVIIGSVLTKTSIPVLHSSAALLKLAEMEYSGEEIGMSLLKNSLYLCRC